MVTHQSMIPSPLSLRRFFFLCPKFYPFSSNFKNPFHLKPISINHKLFSWKLSFAAFSNTAVSYAYDELPERKSEQGSGKVIDFLHVMEQRGVCANSETYLWLLEGCINSGSFSDGWKLHGKILKMGFYSEVLLCERVMDLYIAFGDLDSAVKVFDDMQIRPLSCWNKIIHRFVAKKMGDRVFGLFRQMIKERVKPDEKSFAGVLRACGGNFVPLHYVEQIHAITITHGLETSPLICNPLIDFYFKNGFVNSAKKVFGNLRYRDTVSWLAMISGLSQNGYEEEAILLFCQMHTSGILPTPYIFSSVLSSCTKVEFFVLGEQLHGLILKQGFSSETHVCNALVLLYSRSGNMKFAEHIFNAMSQRDGVSFNSLISGLAQQGHGDKALELFKKMHIDCLKPDYITVASLLSACASVGALLKGKQLHSYAIKSGMSSDLILEGSLLDLYVKCSDIETAHDFFLTTETENVVLWNVMLVAYGLSDNLNESFEIFKQMQIEGILPNEFTYPSILRTCTSSGALYLGEQIHTLVLKSGFQFNVYVSSVLIDMYAKLGKLDTALNILRRVKEKDVVSWTAMIAGYAQHDMFAEALNLFEEMQDEGIQSDNIGFASAISACAGIQVLDQGRQIHAQSCVSGYSDDLSVGNALVSFYARCGKVREAYFAFNKILAKDNRSWNSLISGFAQSAHYDEALHLFAEMNKAGIEINSFAFGPAVSAAANVANVKLGMQIHAMIKKTGYDLETEVSNVLITLYAKCGLLDDAERQFFEMTDKNEVSWNAMITGYSQHGRGFEALKLFEDMKQLGLLPNHVTFVGVLIACSHVGLVDEGISYFKSMREVHSLVPKPEHYACIVDLLGRSGLLSRARRFIEEMPIQPDAMIWRTLLSACIVRKNIDIGEFAASHLLKLEPKDSATYVLLSNMYAVTGKWGCRDRTRQMMKDRGVKKVPGRSWIVVNNEVHAFFAGDQNHPRADTIYEHLSDLNERATEVGYVPQCNILLNDAERGQKNPARITHSEKLTIAFGLLNSSSATPIHVFKNLRVCGDCHNWIKCVSKISNQAIIVRDAYRFHHFEDGVCSCKDYW
ncbi:PREDICTED: pentatricopeptide repeat-containing protein At4g13650 [Lupinus angustifolius]|uniref:pentatricopeptide repeat-containing protein At4g13650 n=1 Tax=Lupinus angustifolius TaxID=3871 RepID=UPI00092FA4F1|nr:PREDICTED: pentatricopeptide repeat-containing protein At4g13650 [Lupinus angustifolius]XP_019453102.1 PREDICTED: pentatricopeptide repeat-containing protein At4g13650 [Lupinus angustifolius]